VATRARDTKIRSNRRVERLPIHLHGYWYGTDSYLATPD